MTLLSLQALLMYLIEFFQEVTVFVPFFRNPVAYNFRIMPVISEVLHIHIPVPEQAFGTSQNVNGKNYPAHLTESAITEHIIYDTVIEKVK